MTDLLIAVPPAPRHSQYVLRKISKSRVLYRVARRNVLMFAYYIHAFLLIHFTYSVA